MQPAQRTAGSSRLRALLPLILCAFAALLFLAWRFHATSAGAARITFDMRVEGEPVFGGSTTLNGISYQSGMPCGVGSRTLRVEVPNAEPFQTNLFVWYRGASFGVINLKHSKGTLSLDVSPSPNTVSIRGPRFQENIPNCERKSFEVPIGDYEVVSKFERFSVSRRVTVSRNSTAPVSIKPSVAALELVAEPASADFELESVRPEGISIKGRTPTTLTSLPTGKYELSIWRGDYRKKVPVTVDSTPTNHVAVVFEYAKVTFKSQPSGAGIRDDETNLGTTPATLSFAPGEYRVSIGKSGYFGTNLEFKVTGTEQREISVTLLNAAYAEAMERARSSLSGFFADYDRAFQEVAKALEIQPGDADATHLRDEIRFRQHFSAAQQLARKSDFEGALKAVNLALAINSSSSDALALKSEIETAQKQNQQALAAEAAERRKKRPLAAFNEAANRMQHNDLFRMQAMRVKGDAEKVRSAIVRSLGGRPIWKIGINRSTEPNIYMVSAEMKSFINKQEVVFVIGQTTDNDVEVYYKVWEYVLGNNVQISLSGVSDDSWRPLHPNYVQGDARVTESRLARTLKNLRDKIEAELR